MRNNDQRLIVSTRACRFQDGIANALAHDLGPFHLGKVALPLRAILRVGLGLLAGDLLVCLTLEAPVEALREPLVELRALSGISSDVKNSCDDPRGIDRAPQRRTHDTHSPIVVAAPVHGGKHTHLGARLTQATHQHASGTRRLGPSGLVQGLIDAPLKAPRDVKVRLAVAQQDDPRGAHWATSTPCAAARSAAAARASSVSTSIGTAGQSPHRRSRA